jgi:hypothetical protein
MGFCRLWICKCGDLLDLYLDVDFGEGSAFWGRLRYVQGFVCLRWLQGKTRFGLVKKSGFGWVVWGVFSFDINNVEFEIGK